MSHEFSDKVRNTFQLNTFHGIDFFSEIIAKLFASIKYRFHRKIWQETTREESCQWCWNNVRFALRWPDRQLRKLLYAGLNFWEINPTTQTD